MNSRESDAQARSTADAVARRSYGKLVAFLAARTRDVAAAEDALSEAFASALADWPREWLSGESGSVAADRRPAKDDRCRPRQRSSEVAAAVAAPGGRARRCAPAMRSRTTSRADVRLRASGDRGRHSRTADSAGVLGWMRRRSPRRFSPLRRPWEAARPRQGQDPAGRHSLPHPGARGASRRLDAVLDAIYAAFTEGWTDPGGTDVVRRDLTEEAMFLARLVTELLPESRRRWACSRSCCTRKPGVAHGARGRRVRPACRAGSGAVGCGMIAEAEALLRRASALGSIGRYQLEGALQSAHVVSLPHRSRQLGGGGAVATIRRAVRAHRLAGGRHQSRAGDRGDARRRRRSRRDAKTSPPMRGSPNTSPTGRRARSCSPGRAAIGEARQAYEIAIGLERDPAVRRFLQRRQSRRCRLILPLQNGVAIFSVVLFSRHLTYVTGYHETKLSLSPS